MFIFVLKVLRRNLVVLRKNIIWLNLYFLSCNMVDELDKGSCILWVLYYIKIAGVVVENKVG